jgi:hypothetical protein
VTHGRLESGVSQLSLTRRCWLLLVLLLGCAPNSSRPTRCVLGSCAPGFSCDVITTVCVPDALDAGGGCKADRDCSGQAPHCLIAEGLCVACRTDGDCAAGSCHPTSHACVGLSDSCATAQPLDLSSGQLTITADTSRAKDDTRLSCSLPGTKSYDLVWLISVTERRRLVVTATPTSTSTLRPALSLRTVCNSTVEALNLSCAYPPLTGNTARLQLDAVDPGTYFLWVEGEDGSSGAFTLDARLEVPPLSDSCAQPSEILISGNTPIELPGDTRGLKDDAAGLCGGNGAPEAVYALKLASARRLRIELDGLSPGYQPVLYMRSTCEDSTSKSQIGCANATAFDIPRVEAGTLFLFIDGQVPSAAVGGTYRLRITPYDPVPPPTNDVCNAAHALVMPTNAIGTIREQGDTSAATPDALGCSASGPDLVYQFTLPVARQMLARVTPLAGSSLKPAVYLRPMGKCDSEASTDERACQVAAMPGAAVTTVVPNLAAGVWFLWVDGALGTAGPFDLQLEFAAPPPVPANDTCGSATVLSLGSGAVNAQGTTLGANADTTTCTLPVGVASPDVVYEVSLANRGSLSVDLKAANGSGLKPVATLRAPNGCASTALNDHLACVFADPQFLERAVYTLPDLDAGSYFLWVSGDDGSQGPFSLRLATGASIALPLNDQCYGNSQLPTLTPGVPVDGDTRAASDDDSAGSSCSLPFGADGSGANDVAFRFALATAQTVVLSVTPDPSEGQLFRPVIYVRAGQTTCSSQSANRGCIGAGAYGGTATLTLNNLAAGTYTAWVDGAGQSSGKFTIRMQ